MLESAITKHKCAVKAFIILLIVTGCCLILYSRIGQTIFGGNNQIPFSIEGSSITPVVPNTDSNEVARKIPQCLERNICLKFMDKDIYHYSRDEYFYNNLESSVDYSARINHSDEVVPRIVHFVWFSERSVTFKFYQLLAMIAADRFANPKQIYFWHNNLPNGKYWDEALSKVKNLYFVYREPPTRIRGQPIAVSEHMADVARLEALLEFGGIYLDLDSYLLYPVHDLLLYDVTMGRELPSGLANGMLFAKAWCDFFKIWHHGYSTFNDKQWATHSVVLPYQLYRKYPNLVHVEENSLIRPHWQELPLLYGNGNHWDWKKYNYAIHLYIRMSNIPDPSPESIKPMNTTVGEVMRYIYYGNPDLWIETKNDHKMINGTTDYLKVKKIKGKGNIANAKTKKAVIHRDITSLDYKNVKINNNTKKIVLDNFKPTERPIEKITSPHVKIANIVLKNTDLNAIKRQQKL